MAPSQENSASLERKVAAKRAALAATIRQLRRRLKPANLAEEATAELSRLSSSAAETVLEKVKSPVGIGATGLGVAMATYFLAHSGSSKRDVDRSGRLPRAPTLDEAKPQTPTQPSPGRPGDHLLRFAAAVGLGVGLNKLIPVSEKEKELLDGVGQEVQTAIDQWTKEQARRLVSPPPGNTMGLVNYLALFIGVLSSSAKRHSP